MGKSSRSIKKKQPTNDSDKNIKNYAAYSKSDLLKKKYNESQSPSPNGRILRWVAVASTVFILLLITGVFSPGSNPGSNDFINNEDLPVNTFTQANGEKISVVLYSSPTCGCCHEYVDYLNENGFDTFQKRTEDYQVIKDENLIPEEQRSCHTAIIGDYFIEGHIPLLVVYDLLSKNPDIDGISLPGMPSGSPGMSGEKNSVWVISSLLNGQIINIFASV
ncbi:MAG: hypothetical protein HeimC2_09710 [Candidatus Heimdallarchaeota archaeon LC_2]|nr:MAG: hypothetical protein HeimC2_09710 [Candidatus Heimdallarchaeota archaeon LC_2]